jgi:hypothetical protein
MRASRRNVLERLHALEHFVETVVKLVVLCDTATKDRFEMFTRDFT